MPSPLVSVVVDAEVSDLRQPYTYRVPDGWPIPPLGSAVVVPFGGQTLLGFVVQPEVERCNSEESPFPTPHTEHPTPDLKEIVDVLDAEPFFDENQWELARWMAERYYCSPARACGVSCRKRSP